MNKLMTLFGIEQVKDFSYLVRTKASIEAPLYFRCMGDGAADFTVNQASAWRFKTLEEALKLVRELDGSKAVSASFEVVTIQ